MISGETLMLMSIAVGETLYRAHRLRRAIILSPAVAMGVGLAVMVVRNWHHLRHLAAH